MPSALRLAVPLLAAAGYTYAADCSNQATTTVQSNADASAFASCKTFSGSIAISTGTTDNIALDGIGTIDGDLILKNNSQIQQLSGADLVNITGNFVVETVQVLNTVNFPKLKNVDSLSFTGLANLRELGFTAGIQTAGNIDIENTQLTSLTGLNVTQADTIKIANNGLLDTIDLPVTTITDIMSLDNNNIAVTVTLNELESAQNLTFRNCSSVSIPNIETINGSLQLLGSKFENFNATNLTSIGGALAIVDNNSLQNISFPALTKIGGALEVANNTDLNDIEFNKLDTVSGALDFHGNITKVSLPALDDVKGSFNIQSTGDIQSTCDNSFKKLKDSSKIQGPYTCKGKVDQPGGEGSTPTSGDGAKKSGAASPMNVQGGAVFAGLAAALFL
ncbi:GPI-anchored cell wall organization protein Ecm33 [Lophiostoma macrostomum CBS 122681]|uniref:GPI-anchored cell wall organization protein Ecm33 n=1 Tax=Lophiostoma macrostomum CBS 122681 TaxID=1314788 RepID=A0A6A6SNF5_9PLEO|nr:GPI-anchored cell wall organization protein Ecm33 [Lophiostoma macrostomum CBS 122681]